jgi:hypothetical protein
MWACLETVDCHAAAGLFLNLPQRSRQLPPMLQGRLQPSPALSRPETAREDHSLCHFASQPGRSHTPFVRAYGFPLRFFSPTPCAKSVPIFFPLGCRRRRAGKRQAEAGYDYQVQSTKEIFSNGEWHTQPIQETRIRWGTAPGKISRSYQNVGLTPSRPAASFPLHWGITTLTAH